MCSHVWSASFRSPMTYPGIASQATSQGSDPGFDAFVASIARGFLLSCCSLAIIVVSGLDPVSETCAQLSQRFVNIRPCGVIRAFQRLADLAVIESVVFPQH